MQGNGRIGKGYILSHRDFILASDIKLMAASIIPNAKQQFIDINGNPLVGGTVGMYVVSTLTPKDTWQDAAQGVLNTNPIILDARGEAQIYGNGNYRQILSDSLGNLIWDKVTSAPIATSTGLWTPTFLASTTPGSWTYSQQYGTYTKIGNVVNITFNLAASGNSSATGQLLMGGLPFPSATGTAIAQTAGGIDWGVITLPVNYTQLNLYLAPNRSFYECRCSGSNQTHGTVTTFGATPYLAGSATYLTDS